MELTPSILTGIMRQNGDLFLKGISMSFEKQTEDTKKTIQNQSNEFKAFSKNIDSLGENIFKSSNRKEVIANNKLLSSMEKRIQASTDLTEEEKNATLKMFSSLSEVNKSLQKNQFSLMKTLGSSLKEKLPSITGVLGGVGLDSPALMFMGGVLQDMADKRREIADENNRLLDEHQQERIKLDLAGQDKQSNSSKEVQRAVEEEYEESRDSDNDLIELNDEKINIMKEHSEKFDYMGSLLHAMLSDGESEKFREIELHREEVRREEALIDAVKDIGNDDSDAKEKELKMPFNFSGIFETIGGLSMLLASVGPVLAGIGSMIAPVAIGLASVYAIYEGFKGALSGWTDAADKLGKESATTSDKIASSVGGWFGGILGIFDSVNSLFGVETDWGGKVDQVLTETLASVFDFFADFENNINKIFTSIKDYFRDKTKAVITFGTKTIDNFTTYVKDFFGKFAKALFPDDFSPADLILLPLRNIKFWIEELFNFDLPEIPSVDAMMKEGAEKLTNTIKEMLESLINLFKDFNLSDFVFGKHETVAASDIERGELMKVLSKEGTVNKNLFGKDQVEDWERMKDLSPTQLDELINSKNFDRMTLDRLKSLKQSEPTEIQSGMMPREIRANNNTNALSEETIDRERQSQHSNLGIVNAPSSTRISTSNSSTAVTQGNISPRNTDSNINWGY